MTAVATQLTPLGQARQERFRRLSLFEVLWVDDESRMPVAEVTLRFDPEDARARAICDNVKRILRSAGFQE